MSLMIDSINVVGLASKEEELKRRGDKVTTKTLLDVSMLKKAVDVLDMLNIDVIEVTLADNQPLFMKPVRQNVGVAVSDIRPDKIEPRSD